MEQNSANEWSLRWASGCATRAARALSTLKYVATNSKSRQQRPREHPVQKRKHSFFLCSKSIVSYQWQCGFCNLDGGRGISRGDFASLSPSYSLNSYHYFRLEDKQTLYKGYQLESSCGHHKEFKIEPCLRLREWVDWLLLESSFSRQEVAQSSGAEHPS